MIFSFILGVSQHAVQTVGFVEEAIGNQTLLFLNETASIPDFYDLIP